VRDWVLAALSATLFVGYLLIRAPDRSLEDFAAAVVPIAGVWIYVAVLMVRKSRRQ
jgi:hypothetical protein